MLSKCVLRNYPGIQDREELSELQWGRGGLRVGDPEAGFQPFLPASTREASLLCIIAPPSTLIFKEVFTAAAIKAKQKRNEAKKIQAKTTKSSQCSSAITSLCR